MAKAKVKDKPKPPMSVMIEIPLNLEGIWFDSVTQLMDMNEGGDEERYILSVMYHDKKVYEVEIGHDYDKLTYLQELYRNEFGEKDKVTGQTVSEVDKFFDKVEEIVRKLAKAYMVKNDEEVEYIEYYADDTHKDEEIETFGEKADVTYEYINNMGFGAYQEVHIKFDYFMKLLPTLFELREIADSSRRISQAFGQDKYYIMLGDRGIFEQHYRFSNYSSLESMTEFRAKTLKTSNRAEALERAEFVKTQMYWKAGRGEIIWQGAMKFELSTEDYLSIFQ